LALLTEGVCVSQVEPTKKLRVSQQRMAWASAMSQRLSGCAASRVHTLSPDLIEMVAHALGSVKGRVLNRLARQTLALRVEREIRANSWQVQRSRAAVARTCAAAAQVRAPHKRACRRSVTSQPASAFRCPSLESSS